MFKEECKSDYYDGPCEVEREKEVVREFKRLKEELSKLNDKLNGLQINLKPVLRESLPETEDCNKEKPCETDLGREIRTNTEKVELLNDVVRDIVKRLEI